MSCLGHGGVNNILLLLVGVNYYVLGVDSHSFN